MKRNGFSPVIVLLILAVVISLGLAYKNGYLGRLNSSLVPNASPTDKTPSMKTYINDKYHYSFEYPENWQLAEEINKSQVTHITDKMSVVTVLSLNNSTIQFFSEQVFLDSSCGQSWKTTKTEKIKINGKAATKETCVFENKPNTQMIIIRIPDASVFRIQTVLDSKDILTLDEILSTFKFN